jgi:hypothetical protein
MQQVGEWLAKLGLAEYAKCFAENRIDFSVLPDLTDQPLKDLGLPLGDRLKMLRAIRELSGATAPSPQPEPRPQDTAERRRVAAISSTAPTRTTPSSRSEARTRTEAHIRSEARQSTLRNPGHHSAEHPYAARFATTCAVSCFGASEPARDRARPLLYR